MKKSIVLLMILLISCAPQVTVTSEVTVTLTLPPTPEATSTPEPIATPTAETVTMGNVIFTVGENGVMTIKEATGSDEATKAKNLAMVDPVAWGCENCDIVKDKAGTHIVAEGQNIAIWVGIAWKWNWEVMEGLEGGNPLFKIAKTYEMNGKSPVDMKLARADSAKIQAFATEEQTRIPGEQLSQPIYLYDDDDRSVAIIGYSLTDSNDNVMGLNDGNSAVVDATVCIMTKAGVVSVMLEKVELHRRSFN